MSWDLHLYTTRTPSEVIEVHAQLDDALVSLTEDGDIDDEVVLEPGPGGGPLPTPDDITAEYAGYGQSVSAEVLERLGQCRSTYQLRKPPAPDQSPLQVSVIRFLLENLAPCVLRWDAGLELGESALGRLGSGRSRGRLKPVVIAKKRVVKPRREKPGEGRAARLVQKLDLAYSDPDVAMDLRAAFTRLSADARRYVELLSEDGVVTDAAAKRRLNLNAEALARVIEEVENALGR
jgi:hypothetical protein